MLAARDLRAVIDGVASAAKTRRGVVLLVGGHVDQGRARPADPDLVERGVVTHIALNGAAAIHDFELAAYGGTSEDVESGLARRHLRHGGRNRTRRMNGRSRTPQRQDAGMGEGLARALAAHSALPGGDASVLLRALEHDVPVTVHAAIGAEIIHQHPSADGAALGATSHRDFRRLAGSLPSLIREERSSTGAARWCCRRCSSRRWPSRGIWKPAAPQDFWRPTSTCNGTTGRR